MFKKTVQMPPFFAFSNVKMPFFVQTYSLLLFGAMLFFASCSNQASHSEADNGTPPVAAAAEEVYTTTEAAADKDIAEPATRTIVTGAASSVAAAPQMPKERKFMRAAELKYRTPDVQKTTETIENWTRQYGGFVLSSELSTTTDDTNTSPSGSDSLLENTIFTLHSNIVLRVPNAYFDTMLVRMKTTMDFLEFRKITADDVSLSMLGNKIHGANAQQMANRMRNAIDRTNKRLGEMTEAEQTANDAQNAADNAALNNLHLQDRVDFCTIVAAIHQRPIVQQRKIQNLDKYINYSPAFLPRIWAGITNGFFILSELLIGIVSVWYLLPLAFGTWWLYRFWKKQKS